VQFASVQPAMVKGGSPLRGVEYRSDMDSGVKITQIYRNRKIRFSQNDR